MNVAKENVREMFTGGRVGRNVNFRPEIRVAVKARFVYLKQVIMSKINFACYILIQSRNLCLFGLSKRRFKPLPFCLKSSFSNYL